MNSIRLGVFDIFGYILPGIAYISLISLSINLILFEELINKIASLSIYSMFACIFVAYIIGFALENIAIPFCFFISTMIKGELTKRIIDKFNRNNPDAKIEKYSYHFIYAFANIYSVESREKSDNFSALSKMSSNLSFAFSLYTILIVFYNIIHLNQINWINLIFKVIIGILISFIFMLSSDRYERYSHEHLLNTFFIISKTQDKTDRIKRKN